MYDVIGSCSLCGGKVFAFVGAWFGVNPPVPRCGSCCATPQAPRGRIIPMQAPSLRLSDPVAR